MLARHFLCSKIQAWLLVRDERAKMNLKELLVFKTEG